MLAGMCGKDLYFVDMEVSVDELAQALSEMLDCHFLPLQVQKWTGKKVLNVDEFRAFVDWLRERGIGE